MTLELWLEAWYVRSILMLCRSIPNPSIRHSHLFISSMSLCSLLAYICCYRALMFIVCIRYSLGDGDILTRYHYILATAEDCDWSLPSLEIDILIVEMLHQHINIAVQNWSLAYNIFFLHGGRALFFWEHFEILSVFVQYPFSHVF